MEHAHRLELRIVVPRRGPVRIELDAQDVDPPSPPAPDRLATPVEQRHFQ